MADIMTNPYRVFRYKVEIGGLMVGAFSEVSGLNLRVQVVEYRVGIAGRPTVQKIPGLTEFGNVTLRRGTLGDFDAMEWVYTVATRGERRPTGIKRRNITITLLNDKGDDGPRWELLNAWPVTYEVSELVALSSEVVFESIELAHEGLTRLG